MVSWHRATANALHSPDNYLLPTLLNNGSLRRVGLLIPMAMHRLDWPVRTVAKPCA